MYIYIDIYIYLHISIIYRYSEIFCAEIFSCYSHLTNVCKNTSIVKITFLIRQNMKKRDYKSVRNCQLSEMHKSIHTKISTYTVHMNILVYRYLDMDTYIYIFEQGRVNTRNTIHMAQAHETGTSQVGGPKLAKVFYDHIV